MCGIAGIYLKDPNARYFSDKQIEDLVDVLLLGIEPRGDHATGVAVMDKDGKTHLEKADTAASTFVEWRRRIAYNPQSIILHTRWATKGSPMRLENNHPVVHNTTYVTHNGHINNDDKLYKEFNIERQAEVDSSIIAALLHKYGIDEAHKALERFDGGFAIASFDERYPSKLLLAKGERSPLVYYEMDKAIFWASTEKCIRDALEICLSIKPEWKDMRFVQTGDSILIKGFDKWQTSFKPLRKKEPKVTWVSAGKRVPAGFTVREKSDSLYSWDREIDWDDELCDGCFYDFPPNKLKKIDGKLYCYKCEVKLIVTDNKEKREMKQLEAPRPIDNDSEVEEFNDEHWAICELVAESFEISPEFVDFMVFESKDLMKNSDPNFMAIYEALTEAYDNTWQDLCKDFSFLKEIDKAKENMETLKEMRNTGW